MCLMVGDVLGPEATAWLADRLPTLRDEHAIDLVIVNAENCAVDRVQRHGPGSG